MQYDRDGTIQVIYRIFGIIFLDLRNNTVLKNLFYLGVIKFIVKFFSERIVISTKFLYNLSSFFTQQFQNKMIVQKQISLIFLKIFFFKVINNRLFSNYYT